ncbi:hypothetical protein Pelo_18493 [Pelomyxa schiedti]|nr:hypothetical protein Pelo_18493 [Pelomyxa schiedti]
MMEERCATGEGTVVLALMPEITDRDVNSRWGYVELLGKEADRVASTGRYLIMLNFCQKERVYSPDKPETSPLGVAFYLLKWNTISRTHLIELIRSVAEVAHSTQRPDPSRGSVPSLLPWPAVPQFPQEEGSIDIEQMDPVTVRSMLQNLLLPEEDSYVQQRAVRTWIKSTRIFTSVIDLSTLPLLFIPPQLEGISCSTLNFSRSQIKEIPDWLFHARVQDVNLNFNLLAGSAMMEETKKFNFNKWEFLKTFHLFGERPACPLDTKINRIVLVGGPYPLKVGLLKCLKENKLKTQVKPTHSKAIAASAELIIKVHNKPFRMQTTGTKDWIAWELGGKNEDWNPFFPCFFLADSIFVLVFDASFLATNVSLQKLHFWLQQLYSCHNTKKTVERLHWLPPTGPKVILVGFYSDDDLGGTHSFKKLFDTITSHWQSKIDFCGRFAVNMANGHGYDFRNDLHPSSHIMQDLSYAIDRQHTSPESKYAPQSWVKLHSRLLGTNTTKAILERSQLARIARECGVGQKTRKISKHREEEEMGMCFAWLSDIGAIFQLGHCSSSGIINPFNNHHYHTDTKNEIFVLEPAWFTEITSKISQDVMMDFGCGSATSFTLDPMRLRATTMHPLEQLGMTMDIHGKPHASFFLLPEKSVADTTDVVKSFWNLGKDHVVVATHGCLIDFGFLPVEAFTTVMCALCNIPDVTPECFWREGIVISMTKSHGKNKLRLS